MESIGLKSTNGKSGSTVIIDYLLYDLGGSIYRVDN
jgi:hypothetical protein